MAAGLTGYKRYLEQARDHASERAANGPIFGNGNRRFWDGCQMAYEEMLSHFQAWFECVEEDDPDVLRGQIAAMREDMEHAFLSIRGAADDAVAARQYLGSTLNASRPHPTSDSTP